MLKLVATLLLLIVTATVVFPQSKSRSRAWLRGTWEGKGYQIDSDELWTMRLTVKGNRYQIEYPSLNCEGRWRPIIINSGKARFRETITRGIEACIDKGNVTIERLSRTQIAFRYSNQGTREVTASAILNRKN